MESGDIKKQHTVFPQEVEALLLHTSGVGNQHPVMESSRHKQSQAGLSDFEMFL
jgi:hypothetical protein